MTIGLVFEKLTTGIITMDQDLSNKSHTTNSTSSWREKLFRMRKAVTVAVLLIVGVGAIVTIQQVQKQQEVRKGAFQNGANITISADKTSVQKDETFTLTLSVSSTQYALTAIEAHLNIPTDTFQVTNYDDTGSFFSSDFKVPPTQSGNDYNFVLTNSPTSNKTGSGKIATLTLKALKVTNTPVAIDWLPATQVTGKGVENQSIIDVAAGAVVTVQGPQNTPTLAPGQKVTLGFSSAQSSYAVGEVFTVDATITTNGLTATAADLNFAFNGNDLTLIEITPGALMPTKLVDPAVGFNNGSISVGSSTNNPPNGTGPIAVLKFKAKKAVTTTQIKYDTGVQVTAMEGGNTNVVGTLNVINLALTATPTSTPVPTNTSTPVPSRTPTPTPSNTPTPTGIQPTATKVPTATPADPQDTVVNLIIKLPAIGSSTTENKAPKTLTRDVKLTLTQNGSAVRNGNGVLTFNGTTFNGAVNMGKQIPAGTYGVSIKLKNSREKVVIVAANIPLVGAVFNVPVINLSTGDINDDNVLDIFDYNVLITCYGNRSASNLCGTKKAQADLNDDGNVEAVDYNVLLTGFRDAALTP